ncbi:MAG: amidase domain-containing protein [Bacillota bacterium]
MRGKALVALMLIGAVLLAGRLCVSIPVTSDVKDLGDHLRDLFATRTRCLLAGDAGGLGGLYDTSVYSGEWALEHEAGRVNYFAEWLRKRDIEIVSVDTSLSLVDAGLKGDSAWASACYNMILGYRHSRSEAVCHLGVRTVHWIEVARKAGGWVIRKDWFWDPFGDGLFPGVPVTGHSPTSNRSLTVMSQGRYNREAAVRYADRYCGVRTPVSDGRYNPGYRDFSAAGGDCANFASQVLSDKSAGGIPVDGAWFYASGKGTEAWLRADAFAYHIVGSGRGVVIKKGKYHAVVSATSELQPGDIIAYERKGTIEHVSIVTGRDACGYVLVNSHTADRYHVPWDLGLGENDTVWLIHIVA